MSAITELTAKIAELDAAIKKANGKRIYGEHDAVRFLPGSRSAKRGATIVRNQTIIIEALQAARADASAELSALEAIAEGAECDETMVEYNRPDTGPHIACGALTSENAAIARMPPLDRHDRCIWIAKRDSLLS